MGESLGCIVPWFPTGLCVNQREWVLGHSEILGGSRDCDMKGSKDPKGSRHPPSTEENPLSQGCYFVALGLIIKVHWPVAGRL